MHPYNITSTVAKIDGQSSFLMDYINKPYFVANLPVMIAYGSQWEMYAVRNPSAVNQHVLQINARAVQ